LKSNENFLDLQKQLEGTENRIAVAINNFNGAVGAYEKYRMNIPEKFVIERFTEYGTRNDAFFQADADAQDVPDVDFDI
jgi:LemA protein